MQVLSQGKYKTHASTWSWHAQILASTNPWQLPRPHKYRVTANTKSRQLPSHDYSSTETIQVLNQDRQVNSEVKPTTKRSKYQGQVRTELRQELSSGLAWTENIDGTHHCHLVSTKILLVTKEMRYRADVITTNSVDDMRGVTSYASTMTVLFDLEAHVNVITGKYSIGTWQRPGMRTNIVGLQGELILESSCSHAVHLLLQCWHYYNRCLNGNSRILKCDSYIPFEHQPC